MCDGQIFLNRFLIKLQNILHIKQNHQMQIVFIPKGKSEDLINYSLDQIESDELDEIRKDLSELDSDYEIQEKNFGEGADWIMLLAVLNGLTTVFLLGDKINTGIDGWVKIGKRIKNIFLKSDRAYIDLEGAKILGIEYLSKEMKIESIKVVTESELAIKDLSRMLRDRDSNDFIARPYSLYLITCEVNDHLLITLGVRSDGKIAEHYRFDRNEFLPF